MFNNSTLLRLGLNQSIMNGEVIYPSKSTLADGTARLAMVKHYLHALLGNAALSSKSKSLICAFEYAVADSEAAEAASRNRQGVLQQARENINLKAARCRNTAQHLRPVNLPCFALSAQSTLTNTLKL